MDIIALVVALAAFGYAYLSQRKFDDLKRRLSRATSNLYDLSSQIEDLGAQLNARDKALRFEIRKAAGQIDFGPQSTIGLIQSEHPYAEQILAGFHMGGCHSCAVAPEETIADACARLEVSETALLAALRNGAAPLPVSDIELQF